MNDSKLIEIFCQVDDFCKNLDGYLSGQLISMNEEFKPFDSAMSLSEIMSICIYYHLSGYKTFKDYYTRGGVKKEDFPTMVSYSRFVQLKQYAIMPLYVFLHHCRLGNCTGLSFCDSSKLAVCHNRRIEQHKTFAGLAERGKTSVDWFFGFKLHLAISHQGELLGVSLSKGNVDDRDQMVIKHLVHQIKGILVADRGYLSQKLAQDLKEKGISLITSIKRNMKQKLVTLKDTMLLKKRALIESVLDWLKEHCDMEHTRHRKPLNFIENVFAALTAYSFVDDKPKVYFTKRQIELLQD